MSMTNIYQNTIPGDHTFFENIPWGTHICGFYQSQNDLINMLVPYFKFGLENNEFCMWVTSEPIDADKAKQTLREYIPNFDYYLKKEQIEVLSYSEWYLNHGKFNGANVLNAWLKKIDEVLANGYKGIRISGNTTWLKKADWPAFQNYESKVDQRIDRLKMIAICTYQISKCNNYEIIDVVKNHKYLFANNDQSYSIASDITRLERLDLMSKMSAGIAHEIRNPITSVKGFLQLLKEKSEYQKHAEYFNIMLEEIDRASSIINEFLSLVRNKEANFTRDSLNNILNMIYPLLQADAVKNGNNIILELEEIPEMPIIPKDIRQLILNLVRNGLEAMQAGGNLTIRTYAQNGDVILEVADEGIGINPDITEKIGSPFFTTKDTGTGLGLAICNNVAAQHNATLKFKKNPAGIGTTFYVQFKLN
ncbi:MEDS domain-containing protein [Pelotomaculum terephthalicicum JT]|uniref:MEDS domain-containing protein n=1 Tax=Pelotomaculum terephthalicicum TaxID=206393 RepID=UPI0009D0E2E0|nr:MEDS domain-containing protein [Pelotomaculum terephthalicicum]MCG9966766.1 MEDS domain-containing protein [Pelotomaculum terephthalicicum JT]OPY60089.1 MAG: Sporulation kinase E [Pelotomaculum sp. PtaU1.Bin065]